jgi:hypothetical protein
LRFKILIIHEFTTAVKIVYRLVTEAKKRLQIASFTINIIIHLVGINFMVVINIHISKHYVSYCCWICWESFALSRIRFLIGLILYTECVHTYDEFKKLLDSSM